MVAQKTLGQHGKEVIEKNFLEENPEIPLDQKVVVVKEMPKMVDIIFSNFRDPGVALQFHYASKNHPLKKYTLFHGQKYLIPQEVVDHLHGEIAYDPHACHMPIHGIKKDFEGVNQSYISDYKQQYQCKILRTA